MSTILPEAGDGAGVGAGARAGAGAGTGAGAAPLERLRLRPKKCGSGRLRLRNTVVQFRISITLQFQLFGVKIIFLVLHFYNFVNHTWLHDQSVDFSCVGLQGPCWPSCCRLLWWNGRSRHWSEIKITQLNVHTYKVTLPDPRVWNLIRLRYQIHESEIKVSGYEDPHPENLFRIQISSSPTSSEFRSEALKQIRKQQ